MQMPIKDITLVTAVSAAFVLFLAVAIIDQPAAANSAYGVTAPASNANLPNAYLQAAGDRKSSQAVLAGGCFWGMELVFSHVKGVTNVVSGYAGGDKAHANYADSSSGRYNDAEAVRISYDPSKIHYADLLRIYFSVAHDPTEMNRQGPDYGSEYRSEIFAANTEQARVARAYIKQLGATHTFDKPIATTVSVGKSFFPAEAYHQNYAKRHPNSLYIVVNDKLKVRALKHRFPSRYTPRFIQRPEKGPEVASAGT